MNIIAVKNYQEMSKKAAHLIIDRLVSSPALTLGLATGGTPLGTYQELIYDHKENGTSYSQVCSFNLDEYIGLEKQHKNSYYTYMTENLFQHIDILPSNTHIPDGMAPDLDVECVRYEQEISMHGGIDLQILGIGHNGHIGFNEPGTSFQSTTHVVTLEERTRSANARYFKGNEEVPRYAITMGIQTIMKAKQILLLVSGSSKKTALDRMLNGEISEEFPASILCNHPNVTIIADEEVL